MSTLQIKHIPEELHEAVRSRAAEEGMSIGDYLLSLIRRDLAVPSQRRWLAELSTRSTVEHAEIQDALEAVRGERDEQLLGTWPR